MNDVWEQIKAIASDCGVNNETLRTWKHRGYVPASRHHELVVASKNTGYPLTYEQLNGLNELTTESR